MGNANSPSAMTTTIHDTTKAGGGGGVIKSPEILIAKSIITGAAGEATTARNINNNIPNKSNSNDRIKGALDLIAADGDERYSLRILPRTTVEHVKVVLEAQYGLDMDQKYLKFNNQQMKEGNTLADYRVRSGDRIIVASSEKDDMSPEVSLYYASLKGNSEKVRSYLARGVSPSFSNRSFKDRTPLHAAAENGHEGVARVLLQSEAFVNARDINERTPLHAAAENGHEGVARVLLQSEAVVNARDIQGLTPIHIAALYGHVSVFRLLLNGGANINIKAQGMKVIHFGAIGGHVNLLEVLETICELTEKTDSGLTPLHLAAKYQKLDTVIWLVEQGVNFNLKDSRGNTAEDLAREEGCNEIVTYLHRWVLLQQRKFLQVVAQGKLGSVMSFLKVGIDMDCKTEDEDEWGHRAIHLASLYGHVDVVTALLLFGVRREAEDDMGSTAMHYAAAGDQIKVMKILKNGGCKLNISNHLNMTPLHFAAIRGKANATRWLLAEGVLGSVKSNTGFSAADIAEKEGYQTVSNILKESQNVKCQIQIKSSSNAEELIWDQSEWQILRQLKHPNIVLYMGCKVRGNTLSILMEYCSGGDLAKRIQQQKKKNLHIPEKLVINWASMIASALNYIHRRSILHRDLKPENIFLSGSEAIKLGDFGLAKLLKEKEFAHSFVGSPCYMSPEVLLQLPYNEKSDMWSFGCILYELTTFHNDFMKFKEYNIPQTFHADFKKLVSSLLNQKPENRPNSSVVHNLPLFKTGRQTSLHQEQFQQQIEDLKEYEQNINNLMKLVLNH
ncbi:putative ankyrin repeat protein RF_0381 isoform X2 [Palaemon carinicauda]|uniref:putative ankyrin repeat protein RF_0381 isoform X2 n=1 Tax=Palaemon carinicauda TaxID=392227 RepID=UPI0035B659AB